MLRLGAGYSEVDYVKKPEDADGLRWTGNASERDFFAALWLVRSSDPAERNWLRGKLQTGKIGDELKELWEYVRGVPDDSLIRRKKSEQPADRWADLVKILFERPRGHARPTEQMWSIWPNLLRRSGFLDTAAWNEGDVQTASWLAQRAYDPTDSEEVPSGHAGCQSILREFLSEFPALQIAGQERGGKHRFAFFLWRGVVKFLRRLFRVGAVPAAVIIDEDLKWCELPGNAGTSYLTGHREESDNPEQSRTLDRSFSMSKYAVTRRVYRLFDDQHEGSFEDYEEYSGKERCPAFHLSWYDSRMLSYWCHADLASEWEWEYACRAGVQSSDGSNPIWWWVDDKSRLQEFAWYGVNSVFHTHPVGDKDPNPWGIHDQLGNVWEWTSSFYREGGSSRVLRGGSWRNSADYCRCSNRRYNFVPAYQYNVTGCRLVRFL